MNTLLLVDGSSYLYRAYHGLPNLRNQSGQPTGAIYGVLNMLRHLPEDSGATYLACIFDAPGKNFRHQLHADYKAHRPPMPDDLRQQIAPLHQAIQALGWPMIQKEGIEADDIIATLARRAADSGMKVIISSGDKDLTQLVNDRITMKNTMSGEIFDCQGVFNKFGVPPEKIVDYLCLIGDTSDNIPGVSKVGPKTAVKWLTEYGSLDAIMAQADEFKGVAGQNLRQALSWLPISRQLVTLLTDLDLSGIDNVAHGLAALQRKTIDWPTLNKIFAAQNFRPWNTDHPQKEQHPDQSTVHAHSPTKGETRAFPVEQDLFQTPIDERQPSPAPEEIKSDYELILTEEALHNWIRIITQADMVAIDTETTSLDPMEARLVGISFSVTPGHAAYLPLAHTAPGTPEQLPLAETLAKLRPWFESPLHKKVGQNLKFDQHILANHSIELKGGCDDTLLASCVLEAGMWGSGGHDLQKLAQRHLGLESISFESLCGKGASQIGFDQVSIEQASHYAAEDADLTLRLHHLFKKRLNNEPGLQHIYRNVEIPVRQVLWEMERHGVLVDCHALQQQSHTLGLRILELEQRAHEIAGQPFNLSSPKQLADILFTQLELPVKKKTPSGTPSTDEEVLSELALDYPLPKLLLEHRSLTKLKNTYTDKLPRMINTGTGRIHTHYSQSAAVTGRLSSSEPNLQNIPIRSEEGAMIREAFIAPEGAALIAADYSQIELRIMAHLSGDPRLVEAFRNGEDIHRATAAEIFSVPSHEVAPEQRRVAKTINFGLIYGMSAFGLARQLGLERSTAQNYIDHYFARYPGVSNYMENTRSEARKKGYVETVFGRRLWLPELSAPQVARRQGAERAAINAPMQGTAADLIKMAMLAVNEWIHQHHLKTRLVLQVHDELVLEVPDTELAQVRSELARLMTGVAHLSVPLEVDIGVGPHWRAAH